MGAGRPFGRRLSAGGVWLRLADGDPPRVDAGDDDTAPLALLLDAALDGDPADLDALLERGADVTSAAASARRPRTGDDVEAARERWTRLGGRAEDDAYVVVSPAAPNALLVPRAALREAWAALRPHAAHVPDLAGAEALEAAARALDADPDPAGAARAGLEARLTEAGVLGAAAAAVVRRRLAEGGYVTLASWADAAAARRSYLASAERAVLPAAVRRRRGDAGVALDWFRTTEHAMPAGVGAAEWLARLERRLDAAAPAGDAGSVTIEDHGRWTLTWRREHGVPVLVATRRAE